MRSVMVSALVLGILCGTAGAAETIKIGLLAPLTGFAAADGALRQRLGEALVSVDTQALPHAADVARLGARAFARGEAIAPDRLEPAYLRDNVALTLDQQQALRAGRG